MGPPQITSSRSSTSTVHLTSGNSLFSPVPANLTTVAQTPTTTFEPRSFTPVDVTEQINCSVMPFSPEVSSPVCRLLDREAEVQETENFLFQLMGTDEPFNLTFSEPVSNSVPETTNII